MSPSPGVDTRSLRMVSTDSSANTPGEREAVGVDIIVPIYGAAEELGRCLESVFRHTALPPHRLLIVVDGPQDRDVEDQLLPYLEKARSEVEIFRNTKRLGFVKSVNRGMSASHRDVVLLNSDTEVSPGWVEQLQAVSSSAENVATVTPLSNNATICSIPEMIEENLLPLGLGVEEMAAVLRSVAPASRIPLPTGVGVCLYITRNALNAVGDFDEKRFGLGYGEENEFCIRADKAGFQHLGDQSTFIFHVGHRSFGSDAARRERSALRSLRRIDPTYIPRVAEFIATDPIRETRQRLVAEIHRRQGGSPASDPLRVLHVVHGWPPFDHGGTEQYAWQLARHQTERHQVAAFCRVADSNRTSGHPLAYLDHGIRVRLIVNNFDSRSPVSRNALKDRRMERELVRFLDQTSPDLVHVHHLAGLGASLMEVIAKRRIPIVYQIQDWWIMCARANLWRSDDTFCTGPSPARCAACLPLTGIRPRSLLNRGLHLVRSRFLARQMSLASAYVMGSRAVLSSYQDLGCMNPAAPVHLLDYGVQVPEGNRERRLERPAGGSPITFGYVGALMPHKGAHVAVEAFRGIDPTAACLEIWGNPDARPDFVSRLSDYASIEFRGRFSEEQKPEVYASMDVLIVPSLGLESFGIVAREAMAAGVPILASRRGALEELEIDAICGATFTAGDIAELRAWIDKIAHDPSILNEWRRALPDPTSVEAHAKSISAVYQQLLGRSP